MLHPGLDDEAFDVTPLVSWILVDGPVDGAVAAANRLEVADGLRKCVCLRRVYTVFDLDTDRAFVRSRDEIEVRLGPVRRRREIERGHRPQRPSPDGGKPQERTTSGRREGNRRAYMLGDETPPCASEAKATLEHQEVDSERASPHPRGDSGLSGPIETGHHRDPRDAAEDHRDAESWNESPEGGQRAHDRENDSREADDHVERQPALHAR